MRARGGFERTAAIAGVIAALALAAAGCQKGELGAGDPVEEVSSPIIYGNGTQPADYVFYTVPRTWADAKTVCSPSYHLVNSIDINENNFIITEAARHGAGATVWWLGYSDQVTEGTWVWEGGYQPGFVNWNTGEPNNLGNEDCATINIQTGKWNDVACTNKYNFICKHDNYELPAPLFYTFNATQTNSATTLGAYAQFGVDANAGQGITLGTCGISHATANGDTFLRLLAPDGTQVAMNDDACGGFGSNLSYAAELTGTYWIHAGCFGSGTCSGDIYGRIDP
jgi:hypothetical protein